MVPWDPLEISRVPILDFFQNSMGLVLEGLEVTPIPVSALVDLTANNRDSGPMCRPIITVNKDQRLLPGAEREQGRIQIKKSQELPIFLTYYGTLKISIIDVYSIEIT